MGMKVQKPISDFVRSASLGQNPKNLNNKPQSVNLSSAVTVFIVRSEENGKFQSRIIVGQVANMILQSSKNCITISSRL